ncbi:MAG: hypothetical protein J6V40_04055 [Clostridia bacterium]|nr:hypothetical protein [Clostridia bacterium]
MNSVYKRIITIVCAVVMVMSCGIFFNACSCTPSEAAKIMNLSLNPEIEFILDSKNKVVSVTAINDEGNYIISKVNFVGLTSNEAVEEFLKICSSTGYILQESSDNSTLKISISGETAEEMFNELKVEVDSYITGLEVAATVEIGGVLDKEYIESVILNCMRECVATDFDNVDEADLILLLADLREETKNMLSQEVKELYYRSRYNEIIKQKYIKIKNNIEANALVSDAKKAEFLEKITNMVNGFEDIKAKYEELFINSNSSYQLALKNYYSKKKELLDASINKLSPTQKSIIIGQLDMAKTTLQTAKSTAELALISFENAATMALSAVEMWLSMDNALSLVDENMVNQTIENTKATYKATFNSKYSNYVKDSYWDTYWSVLDGQ